MSAGPSIACACAWDLVCPSCRGVLTAVDPEERVCLRCDVGYRRIGGIWRMLAPGRLEATRGFVERYEAVRMAEGRRLQDSADLRALPFRDRSRERSREWAIRARSYEALIRRVVAPLERPLPVLRVVDLGSGLGWLAYRLATRGHAVAAVDLVTNDFDGLGVHRRYDRAFLPIQAEFDRLPFADASVDLAIYNASLHYAADYAATLREGLRVLAPGAPIVVLDTPIYRDASSGVAMVRRRDEAFEATLGPHGRAPRSEGFLTYDRLDRLAEELGLRWRFVQPWYGARWAIEPALARFRRTGEPARFKIVVGRAMSAAKRGPARART
jgi:SAM-dependent methyltransferase